MRKFAKKAIGSLGLFNRIDAALFNGAI